MVVDIIFLILMVLAIYKGISRGFIVAVFSLIAFIVGVAAALKLSATVATHLHEKMNLGGPWLPILSFLVVFVCVVLVVRWGAGLVKKAASILFLGWIDTLAGIILYVLLYLMVFSVILFYASRIHLITPEVQAASKTYSYIEPFGPKVMSLVGKALPFFNHMFSDLTRFFDGQSTGGQ
ncbi:MAG TPA: CvpA family protein [Segetibacter sp.]|nr:CvpA family protein [Segetibacter sp.]